MVIVSFSLQILLFSQLYVIILIIIRKGGSFIKKTAIKNLALSIRERLTSLFCGDDREELLFEAFLRGAVSVYMSENALTEEYTGAELTRLMPCVFREHEAEQDIAAGAAVVKELLSEIPSGMWKSNVRFIGQLYQYCNSVKKDSILGGLRNSSRVGNENMATATQIFTPDWIARYMTENTLGRLFSAHCGFDISKLEYYIPRKTDKSKLPPEKITLLDPCVGSGNILVCAFDMFMELYRAQGRSEEEAAVLILENNLFGIDIDSKVCRIARAALLLKAADYSRNILGSAVVPQVYDTERLDGCSEDFSGAELFGSLIRPGLPLSKNEAANGACRILSRKYNAVVTNPPYMSCSNMNKELLGYLKREYADYHADLFSAFIVRCCELAEEGGYLGFLTPYVWMFIRSYEKLRRMMFNEKTLETLVHFEYSSFEDATVPVCAFTLRNCRTDVMGVYIRLTDFRGGLALQREKFLAAITDKDSANVYETSSKEFEKIPNAPAAYWISGRVRELYSKYPPLGSISAPRKGNSTSDNDRFLRLWHEVDKHKMNLGSSSIDREDTLTRRWFPYNKGGGYQKWYGFNDYLIDWYDDAAEIRRIPTAVIANYQYFTKAGLTWSTVTSGKFSIRQFGEGYIFDNGGCCIFGLGEKKNFICALLNSKVFEYIFGQLNPTLNFQSGEVAKFPVIYEKSEEVDRLAEECTAIAKAEYDSYETSRDFKRHPLI